MEIKTINNNIMKIVIYGIQGILLILIFIQFASTYYEYNTVKVNSNISVKRYKEKYKAIDDKLIENKINAYKDKTFNYLIELIIEGVIFILSILVLLFISSKEKVLFRDNSIAPPARRSL